MDTLLYGMFFFFQAEDGIRDLVRSRGLGDVYKRQEHVQHRGCHALRSRPAEGTCRGVPSRRPASGLLLCLLYTSDAADDLLCVDLGGRRIIKKKTNYTSILRDSTAYLLL